MAKRSPVSHAFSMSMNSLRPRRADAVGGELRVLVGGLGGGQLDPALALGGLAVPAAALRGALGPPRLELGQPAGDEPVQERERDEEQQTEAVAEQGDVDEQADDDEEGKAAAAAATAPSPPPPLKPDEPPPAAASAAGATISADRQSGERHAARGDGAGSCGGLPQRADARL